VGGEALPGATIFWLRKICGTSASSFRFRLRVSSLCVSTNKFTKC